MSGFFTPGLLATPQPFTGNERIPLDTGLTQGLGPESAYVSSSLLGNVGFGALQIGSVSGATATLNAALGSHWSVTLTTTGHTLTVSNPSPGQEVEIEIVQGGSGSCTITTYTNGSFPTNNTLPTLTTTVGHIDIVKGTWNETSGHWRFATKGLDVAPV